MSKTELVMAIRADLRQIALEEMLGQVECNRSHDTWWLPFQPCPECGAAL